MRVLSAHARSRGLVGKEGGGPLDLLSFPSCADGSQTRPVSCTPSQRQNAAKLGPFGSISSRTSTKGVGEIASFTKEIWRRRPDLNRGWRFCRPLPYHLATAPVGTGDRSLLEMSARVYRLGRQRRTGGAKILK